MIVYQAGGYWFVVNRKTNKVVLRTQEESILNYFLANQ